MYRLNTDVKKIQSDKTQNIQLSLLIGLCFFFMSFNNGICQDVSYFKDLVDPGSYEKLSTAFENKERADKLIGDIALLNQEYFKLESDYELTQKQFEKKAAKIQKEIKSLREEAYKTYKESNETIYTILVKSLKDEGNVDGETKSLAIDYAKKEFDKAAKFWKDSDNAIDEIEALNILTNATECEQKAIDELANTLGSIHGQASNEKSVTSEVSPFQSIPEEESISKQSTDEEYTEKEPTVQYVPEEELESLPVNNESLTEIAESSTEVVYPEHASVEEDYQEPATIYDNTVYPETTVEDEQTVEYENTTATIQAEESPELEEEQVYSTPSYPASSEETDFSVNQKLINNYTEYLKDETIPEPFTIYQLRMSESEVQYDSAASKYWASYNQSTNPVSLLYAQKSSTSDYGETSSEEVEYAAEIVEKEDDVTTQYSAEPPTSYSTNQTAEMPETYFYRVQIAVNKEPLANRTLQAIYYGNKKVGMLNEDGWYKYSIGDFETYNDADAFRISSGLTNSYIVKYTKSVEFSDIAEPEKEIPVSPSPVVDDYIPELSSSQSGIEFRVQIAASKVMLSLPQFKHIYSGNTTIKIISEDGWFKYQSLGFTTHREALRLAQMLDVRGVFILAYRGNDKIELKEAKKKTMDIHRAIGS